MHDADDYADPPLITAELVKELESLFGECVAVRMPGGEGPLWVISTENKHYDGAHTVYGTSEQVSDLAEAEDYDQDGDLTEAAAQRIADAINEAGPEAAAESARGMKRPDGYTAHVMNQMQANS